MVFVDFDFDLPRNFTGFELFSTFLLNLLFGSRLSLVFESRLGLLTFNSLQSSNCAVLVELDTEYKVHNVVLFGLCWLRVTVTAVVSSRRTGLTDLIGAFVVDLSFFDEDLLGVKWSSEVDFKVVFWVAFSVGLSKSNRCDGASSECW